MSDDFDGFDGEDDEGKVVDFLTGEPTTKYKDAEKIIEHPLEEAFGIEPGTTVVEYKEREPLENCEHGAYDNKDKEIEDQIQEVYDIALESFENITEEIEGIEGKYKARNNEVAVQYLQLALNAAKEKKELKQQKDKLEVTAGKGVPGGGGNTTNIMVTQSDMIEMFKNAAMETPDYNDEFLEAEYSEEPTEEPEETEEE